MNEYKQFSYFYDEVMSSLNYKLWLDFIKPYINKSTTLLDLACGTGSFLMLAFPEVKTCVGLDLSETAIEIAKEKSKINHFDIKYVVADMINFKCDTKFDVITCFFDSINFLNSLARIKDMFNSVYETLNDKGYFIFDIFSHTLFKEYKRNHFKQNYENFKIDWKTRHEDKNTLVHKVKIKSLAKTYIETYYEYYYDLETLDFSQFNVIKKSGDFKRDLKDDDERILIVLQKDTKKTAL